MTVIIRTNRSFFIRLVIATTYDLYFLQIRVNVKEIFNLDTGFDKPLRKLLMRITKTDITRSDGPFLFSLYSETREKELGNLSWDDRQKDVFLQHQFHAQHQHYISRYEDGSFQIIKSGDVPIGRLYAAELAGEIRIIDITILSEFRGKKIGTTLIEEILQEADEKNKAVQIYLETNNRSVRLFTRLGFAPVTDEGIYQLWQRPANSRTNTAEA